MINRSQLLLFGIIIALASALTGVVVYHFTENSNQVSIVTKTPTPIVLQGVTRTYYIAADQIKWNYAPTGINQITGVPLKDDDIAAVYAIGGKDRIGSTYIKCLYRGYTDSTFTTLQDAGEKWEHLGMLGPVIHAEVGDTIKVVFKNNCSIPASMHPHGVFYDKASEGAPYDDGVKDSDKPGEAIPPGGTYTYIWQVPVRAGPGPHDPSSIVWMYHSHVHDVSDSYAGLEGPMIITRHGEANPDGTPKDVDREFVTMFSVMNENNSPYIDKNIQTFAQVPSSVNKTDDEFQESNLMHSINGYVFGNLPGLKMKANTHVRWYVIGIGTEVDLHTPHWHGNTLLMDGMRTDMVELLPMSMKTLDMYPDNVGTWLYHCHVNDHILAGMMALYTVEKNNETQGINPSGGTIKIGLSTDGTNPTVGQLTQFKINFIDNQTNSIEEHVDYKITIMKGTTQVFGTSLLHTSDGSVAIPYQFQTAGSYHIVVEVDGIWFMPASETAEFPINVASS